MGLYGFSCMCIDPIQDMAFYSAYYWYFEKRDFMPQEQMYWIFSYCTGKLLLHFKSFQWVPTIFVIPVWFHQCILSTKNFVHLKNPGSLSRQYFCKLQALSYTTTDGALGKRVRMIVNGIFGDSPLSMTWKP